MNILGISGGELNFEDSTKQKESLTKIANKVEFIDKLMEKINESIKETIDKKEAINNKWEKRKTEIMKEIKELTGIQEEKIVMSVAKETTGFPMKISMPVPLILN